MSRNSVLQFFMPLCLLLTPPHLQGQAKSSLTLDDMFKVQRVSAPSVSPNGKWVAYTLTIPDVGANKNLSDLWLVSTDGKTSRRLTTHPATDRNPAWSPDGKWIAFESSRSGTTQIWVMNSEGGEPMQYTTLSTGASQPVWSPDGKSIAFVSEVFPEYSTKPFAEADELNRKRQDELDNGRIKAKIITRLLYRHWDHWVDGKRNHLFIQNGASGTPRNLTPGDRDAVPTSSTFSAGIDFAFSPDGKEIAYTATPVPAHEEAWSTNHDIYVVSINGGEPRQITTNPASDGYPRYSSDGKYIAYRAQSVPGFEADRWQLMVYERSAGTVRSLTATFDSHVESPVWSPDGSALYFHAEEKGNVPLWKVTLDGEVARLFGTATNGNLCLPFDGKRLYFTHTSAVRPMEVYSIGVDGKGLSQVTHVNDELFATLDIPAPEAVWFKGDGGTNVHAWLYKPPAFNASAKYPLVYLVHGGPQGAWTNAWSSRWNPALWAAEGYVVMAPNPRGSTGFGQTFVNEISGDWGGKVFIDLMKGLEHAESLPYVDRNNKAAAGASYGGYMMNWFQGNAPGRFKTLVTHCGVFNFESMYGTTEEVWFDEWDHGGTPWEKPDGYAKYSPHRYAKNFSTPNLVIHNELDYRVPLSEGMQLFTTLQRKGIPSKFLYFPDEGHWVLKPGNSKLWHETVFSWLAEYLKTAQQPQ